MVEANQVNAIIAIRKIAPRTALKPPPDIIRIHLMTNHTNPIPIRMVKRENPNMLSPRQSQSPTVNRTMCKSENEVAFVAGSVSGLLRPYNPRRHLQPVSPVLTSFLLRADLGQKCN